MYCFYFITIVCKAVEKTSDKSTYQNLPIVYNKDKDCRQPQTPTDGRLCSSKVWHVTPNRQLLNFINVTQNVDIEDCFELCLNTTNCMAVTRKAYEWTCWMFDNDKESTQSNGASYSSYILTCCELNDNRRTVHLNYKNFPVVFLSRNIKQVCKPFQQQTDIDSCQTKAFILWERNTVTSYKYLENKNAFECMNECLQDVKCQVFSNFVYHNYLADCKLGLLQSSDNYSWHTTWVETRHGRTFQMSCCQLKNDYLWTPTNHNLMMLYHPETFCKTVLLTENDKNCKVKIWHVEEEVRRKGHFKVSSMEYLEHCLAECLTTPMCFSVSIDWTYVRCLLFTPTKHSDIYYEQVAWTSYTLKCCDSFGKGSILDSTNGGQLQPKKLSTTNEDLPTRILDFLNLLWAVN